MSADSMYLFDNFSTFRCINCSKNILFGELFVSPNCFVGNETNHYYCINCASKIIIESLSLLNQTPKCIITNCNKSFNISLSKATNNKLCPQYKMIYANIKQYKNESFLLHGYIRQNTKNKNMLCFPKEIAELIHDFYKLVFFTEVKCDNCHSSGFETCNMCMGNGIYTSKCLVCTDGILKVTETCPDCLSGKQKVTVECNCFMNYYAVCSSCDGCGIVSTSYGRGECSDCNGSGDFCPDNCNNGFLTDLIGCNHCNGTGKISKNISTCLLCDGNGNTKQKCFQCGGSSKMKCYKCESNGSIFYTDFQKVICKQQYCYKCNIYHPNNKIINWSDCCHTYCDQCIIESDYIETEMHNDRIPVCPLTNCTKELNEKDILFIFHAYSNHYVNQLKSLLKALKFKKNNFDCLMCGLWHPNTDMLLLSGCGCKCTKKCAQMLIKSAINEREMPICIGCGSDHAIEMDDIELICGKKYVYFVEMFKYHQEFESLITRQYTKIYENDIGKILKIRHDGLHYNDSKLNDKIIDFLSLTNIKIEDIKYLNIIPTKRRIPLFQLFLKNKTIALNINSEILNLKHKNVSYQKWNVGFWEIYNQQYKQQFSARSNSIYSNYNNYNNRYCRNIYNSNNNSQSGLVCGRFYEQRGKISKTQNW